MTGIPVEGASNRSYDDTPTGFLDNGLRQMEGLQVLMDEYCEHLSCQSIYRFIL